MLSAMQLMFTGFWSHDQTLVFDMEANDGGNSTVRWPILRASPPAFCAIHSYNPSFDLRDWVIVSTPIVSLSSPLLSTMILSLSNWGPLTYAFSAVSFLKVTWGGGLPNALHTNVASLSSTTVLFKNSMIFGFTITFTMMFVLAVPARFVAVHWYSPASSLFTFVMVSTPVSGSTEKRSTLDRFWCVNDLTQVNLGGGLPRASHFILASFPSIMFMGLGISLTVGRMCTC